MNNMRADIEADVRRILATEFGKAPADIELHIPFNTLSAVQRERIHGALSLSFGISLPSLDGSHSGERWHNPVSSPEKVIDYLMQNWFSALTQGMPEMMDEVAA